MQRREGRDRRRVVPERPARLALREVPIDEQLSLDWRSCARTQEPLALLMLDLDYFKQYNDEFGHLAGDECLRKVAHVLQQTLGRPYDLLARFGGEEFVVLLPRTELSGARFLAERMLQRVADLHLPHPLTPTGQVSLSAGLACAVPLEQSSPLVLLQQADDLLYKAKQAGRNQLQSMSDRG